MVFFCSISLRRDLEAIFFTVALVIPRGENSEDGIGGFLFDTLAAGLWSPSWFCFVSWVIPHLHETAGRAHPEFWGLVPPECG